MTSAMQVLIPVADGFEDMEVVISCDILRRAGLKVVLAGLDAGLVTGGCGLRLQPDALLADVVNVDIDIILLPGGNRGVQRLTKHQPLIQLLRERHRRGQIIAAICAAPGMLATHHLLDGRQVTAYPGILDPQSADYIYQESAVVVDGPLVTSRGPGTAMDFALTLVELLLGPEKRRETEAPLQRSTPETSPLSATMDNRASIT
ncbi:DJ-1/PfpI family protein [Acidithiobacillus ferriphilus]|nr:DJ-1/PfpI family protein [Acidithiobacillus ferriphilus]MBU2833246.1 DJ-1/PfpI family protein [Acidithiobacillus ferriphilus]MBU2852615.1 DJ-1/PfpI family protein [Acidithiobacillus ferriphilus]